MRSAHVRPLSPPLPLAGGRVPAKDRSYRLDTGRLVMAPGRGQEVGEDPVDLRIQGQADMAAVDLDRVDIGPQARLPVHDPVGTRVDRRRGTLGAARRSRMNRISTEAGCRYRT